MSNGRYTLCPFYVDENKNTVSCEDVCRSFDGMDEKWRWMAMYCDSDWMSCPFAIDLNEAYYRQEKGDSMALQEHEIKALNSEIKSLRIKLGLADKKIGRLQKQLDKEKEINKSWLRKSDEDEKKKRMFFDRMREAQEAKAEIEKHVYDELDKMSHLFEIRTKYLMSMTGGTFKESDAKKWCEDHQNIMIIGHYAEVKEGEEQEITWELKESEAVEDEENNSEGISGNVEAQPESEQVSEQEDEA